MFSPTSSLAKKYITFDCYGTLIDWESGISHAIQKIVRTNGLNLDLNGISDRYIKVELAVEQEQYRKYSDVLKLSIKQLFKNDGFDITRNAAAEFANSIYSWRPFPETHNTLAELKKRGYKLVILSNVDNEIIRRSIELIDIDFDGIITAEEVGSYKPAYGHWEEMLKRFDTEKVEVLHVAASYVHDVVPAKEQGFDTIWINRSGHKATRSIQPDAEFSNLSPLLDMLNFSEAGNKNSSHY